MGRVRWAGGTVAMLAWVAVVGAPGAGATDEVAFQFQDPAISESSGLAASRWQRGVVYTHNDSGDVARFFAVDEQGCTLLRAGLAGAEAVDWEDMALGPGRGRQGTLWFGDIGDNAERRASIALYAVEEPRVRAGACAAAEEVTVPAIRYELSYVDGPRDAEALVIDPRTGRAYVITKATLPGTTTTVHEAPLPLRTDRPNVLRPVAEVRLPTEPVIAEDPLAALPAGVGGREVVTGADIAPDGSMLVLRTYTSVYRWEIGEAGFVAALAQPPTGRRGPSQPQGEAVTFTPDGGRLLLSSEDPLQQRPPVLRIAAR